MIFNLFFYVREMKEWGGFLGNHTGVCDHCNSSLCSQRPAQP